MPMALRSKERRCWLAEGNERQKLSREGEGFFVAIFFPRRYDRSKRNGEGCSMRTIAVGMQDFAEIREKNYFYVDKTAFIKEWWECAGSRSWHT